METATIRITGMHCQSCEMLIKDSLEDEEGVTSAEVSNEKGTAEIVFDGSKTSEEKLKSIIKEEGYGV